MSAAVVFMLEFPQMESMSLIHVSVAGEEVVQDTQRRLQIAVHNILGSWLGPLQSSILHQLKGEGDVVDLLIKILWREKKVVQWHKVALQQPHQKDQVNTVCKLRIQLRHFKVELVQMFVNKCNQRLFDNVELVRCMVKESVKGVTLVSARESLCVSCDLLLDLSGLKDAFSFLHDHHLNRHVIWKSDGCSEVLGQRHQQV